MCVGALWRTLLSFAVPPVPKRIADPQVAVDGYDGQTARFQFSDALDCLCPALQRSLEPLKGLLVPDYC